MVWKRIFVLIFFLAATCLVAIEFNWNGEYRCRGTYNNTFANDYYEATQTTDPINWIDMRIRLNSELRFNPQIKLVTQFEIKDVYFGVSSAGGGIGTDGRTNFVPRHAYLDFESDLVPISAQVGLMPVYDYAHGMIFDDDAAVVSISPSFYKNIALGLVKIYDYWDNPQESDNDENLYFLTYGRKLNPNFNLHLGSYFKYDKDRRYNETPETEGTPSTEFYLFGSGWYKYKNLVFDLALAYNDGHDRRDREHSGYAVSFKPSFTYNKFRLDGTFLLVTAEDDTDVYVEESDNIDFSRKYVDVGYFTAVYSWYESGLELLSLGVNAKANVGEITDYIDLGYYGQIQYVGKLTYNLQERIKIWTAAGMVSRMAEKYVGDDADGNPEFMRQGIGSEIDFGLEMDLLENLKLRFVAAFAKPDEDYFGSDTTDYYGYNTVLTYKF